MSAPLIEYLAKRYIKQGFRVYGPLPGHPQSPEGWAGPFPELYVEKGEDRIAFLFQPHDICLNESAPRKLQLALENPGVKIHLVSSCAPCTCGIKEEIQNLPKEQSERVSIRRFVRGKVFKSEFLRFYVLGLTVKGWLFLLPFLLVAFFISISFYCFQCGTPSWLGFLAR